MADIFLLRYLQKTVKSPNAASDWAGFKARQVEGINLAQADLENHDLRGFDLSGANLSAANMYNARLAGANLEGANLAYANLNRADLAEASLRKADLSGTNLEGVNAVKAHFEEATLSGCKLRGAHLEGADFTSARLENADFRAANLRYAILSGARLSGANVEEAILAGCQMDESAQTELHGLAHAILDEQQRLKRPQGQSVTANDGKASPRTIADARNVLQVSPEAQRPDIVKAYRKLVMQYHPDCVQHLGEKLKKVAEEEFQRVQKAYELLTDESVAAQAEAEQKQASREYTLHELLMLARQHPNNDRIYYNLGRKFFEAGNLERAIDAYEKALQLNPDNQFAAHNLKIARLTQTLGQKK